jgi:hypothetical protein
MSKQRPSILLRLNSGWILLMVAVLATPGFAGPPGSEVLVRPEAAPGPLDNPLKGWCTYTDAGPIRQPYSMVFLYSSWKDLEPEPGRYAFDRWESTAWSVPEAKGKHVVLRVYVDYPTKPSGLPDWLKAQGVKLTPYSDHGGGLSPDYDDPQMVSAMIRFIEAMGRRYDLDPRVGFIQLGMLGFWGEWHTYPQGKLYASTETEQKVIEAYHRAFPHKILLARTARGNAGKQPWIGFHDDMFPEDTDNGQDWSFLAVIRASSRGDNWKKASIGGEMVPGAAKTWLIDRYDQTANMVKRAHFSWVGPYSPAIDRSTSPVFKERSEALVRLMGYQFRLDEVKHPASVATGKTLSVAIQGTNEGVAPFPYPWPVEISLIDAGGKVVGKFPIDNDVRTWLPGGFVVDATVKVDVPPGRYKLALGISDPWTKRPAVGFASKLPRLEGWTVLSTVEVEPSR